MPSTSDVLHSLIFSSEMRHQRSIGLRRRRSRELTPVGVSRDGRGVLREGCGADVDELQRPWSAVGLLLSEGEASLEEVLWKERRELEVVGRGRGGVSWAAEAEAPESEVEELLVERLPLVSGSGLLRGAIRGLGAAEGFSLATRL